MAEVFEAMPENSVLVVDNGTNSLESISFPSSSNFSLILASYHNARSGDVPKAGARKDELLVWLRSQKIDVGEQPTVKKLRQLRADYLKKNPCYEIDRLARSKGITILRLPPYHCEASYLYCQINLISFNEQILL